jgi:DNA polymerase sigma
MTNSLISIKDLKYNNILYLCQKIKDCFQCEISIEIYGSYSTGMEIESSDIDISINLMNEEKMKNTSKENLINDLNNFLSNDSVFENLFPITATSVPILKLVINQYNIKTKVDLTFNLENTKNIINYYTNILKKNPEIKPLTLIIKKLIRKNHLNRVFEGGLSSHSIFIMVASNIKLLKSNNNNNNNKLNLGELLLDLLRFYGYVFNYTNTIIDITKNNPYVITQEYSKIPIFLDPITNINISKSSYQFDKVKDLFYNTYTMLVQNENDIEGVFEKQFGKI